MSSKKAPAKKKRKTEKTDLKPSFIRALLKEEKFCADRSWTELSFHSYSTAINNLEFFDRPLYTAKAAKDAVSGIGQAIKDKIEANMSRVATDPPKYWVSSTPAILTALFRLSDAVKARSPLVKSRTSKVDKDLYFPASEIISEAGVFCEEEFDKLDDEGNPLNNCLAWVRISKMNSTWIKKHKKGGKDCWELLPEGEAMAKKIMERVGLYKPTPPLSGSSCSPLGAPAPPPMSPSLANGMVILVDHRERNGDLHSALECFTDKNIAARIEQLPRGMGDYFFLRVIAGLEFVEGTVVERKEIVDLALSMRDGRLEKQSEAMRKLKRAGLVSNIVFIIEGKPVPLPRCQDNCQSVGQCGNPTVDEVNAQIERLRSDPDFHIEETKNFNHTISLLINMAKARCDVHTEVAYNTLDEFTESLDALKLPAREEPVSQSGGSASGTKTAKPRKRTPKPPAITSPSSSDLPSPPQPSSSRREKSPRDETPVGPISPLSALYTPFQSEKSGIPADQSVSPRSHSPLFSLSATPPHASSPLPSSVPPLATDSEPWSLPDGLDLNAFAEEPTSSPEEADQRTDQRGQEKGLKRKREIEAPPKSTREVFEVVDDTSDDDVIDLTL